MKTGVKTVLAVLAVFAMLIAYLEMFPAKPVEQAELIGRYFCCENSKWLQTLELRADGTFSYNHASNPSLKKDAGEWLSVSTRVELTRFQLASTESVEAVGFYSYAPSRRLWSSEIQICFDPDRGSNECFVKLMKEPSKK